MNKFSQIYLFDHAEPLQLVLNYFKDYQKFLLVNLPFELSSPDDSVRRLTKLSDIIDINGITVIINPNNIINGLRFSLKSCILLSNSATPLFLFLCTKDDFSIFKNIDHTLITSNRRSFPIYLTSNQFYFFKRGRIHALEFSLTFVKEKLCPNSSLHAKRIDLPMSEIHVPEGYIFVGFMAHGLLNLDLFEISLISNLE